MYSSTGVLGAGPAGTARPGAPRPERRRPTRTVGAFAGAERRRPPGWRGLAPNADCVPNPNSAAGAERCEKRQGRQGCGRLRAVARGERPKSRPKSGVESPFGKHPEDRRDPGWEERGSHTSGNTPAPPARALLGGACAGLLGPRVGGRGGSAPELGGKR